MLNVTLQTRLIESRTRHVDRFIAFTDFLSWFV